ncbi:MAG: PIG-L family deacetylase [Proteobacteria bacterium]|nr:PIG-L family deacetylase [Pseudomonadota bacterium]
MGNRTILAIGCHPDDLEYGCSGTLIQFADKGWGVYLLIMTRGELGGAPEVRQAEQMASAEIMGVKEVFWGGFSDTLLPAGKELIQPIEEIIARVKPGYILCHWREDTHQDHRRLNQATVSATRYIRNVLFYEGPTTENFQPRVFVDVTNVLDRKMQALDAHRSQVMRTNIEGLSIKDMARSCSNFRGTQGRVQFAEAFHAHRFFFEP